MESVGIALGIAGLFNSALECFELVRIGQDFDSDIENHQAKVRLLQIRLSQWGEAIGLGQANKDTKLPILFKNQDVVRQALSTILQLVDDVEKTKVAQARRVTESEFSARMKEMCGKMRDMSMKRKNTAIRSSFLTKTKWAITEHKEVDKLVKSIGDLINELIAAFPADTKRKEICDEDAKELAKTEDALGLLEGAWGKDDAMLKDALSKIAGSVVYNSQSTIHGNNNNKGMIQGTNHGTMHNSFG